MNAVVKHTLCIALALGGLFAMGMAYDRPEVVMEVLGVMGLVAFLLGTIVELVVIVRALRSGD